MTQISSHTWDELSQLIDDSNIILLSTHINADGDGLGSEIAFYYYLKELGKDCRIINATGLPYNYAGIDPDKVVELYSDSCDNWLDSVDLTIVFDIGDHRRTGPIGEKVYTTSTVVSIDHHPPRDNHPFTLNIVDLNAPATGYMIWKYFQHIGMTDKNLELKIANGLYVSLVTDTGSFKYQSTTSDTHLMAAYLLDCGVDGYALQREIYEQRRIPQIKMLGDVIRHLKYSKSGKIVWVIITQEMKDANEAEDGDVDGFTEFVRAIESVEVAFMIQELQNRTYRINFRSSGNVIINDIAQSFGGGGHKFAAGARISDLSQDEIETKILHQLSEKIPGEVNGN
ncbi:MAG: bifunctional oligoribonuclease/PAP phosphatase NrnA [Candidatus Marinimicrobia bacterium]|nr:bifunctional oligoribonuclease/PAP phosphatase NrnA [Candidatus Neomarinimicrobiota bacterium]